MRDAITDRLHSLPVKAETIALDFLVSTAKLVYQTQDHIRVDTRLRRDELVPRPGEGRHSRNSN